MATSRTLAELRVDARRRADMSDDGNFISDAEANDYINESISALWRVLTDGDNARLFAQHAPILTQIGDNQYELPSTFFKLVSVDLKVSGKYNPLLPADVREVAQLAADPPDQRDGRYRLAFDSSTGKMSLYIYPAIDENNLAVVFVPEPTVLTADGSTVYFPNHWYEFVAVDAAIKMLQKEESDTTALEFKRKSLMETVADHIRDMDSGLPDRIRDIDGLFEDRFYWFPRSRN